jgi:hypothetical protein
MSRKLHYNVSVPTFLMTASIIRKLHQQQGLCNQNNARRTEEDDECVSVSLRVRRAVITRCT